MFEADTLERKALHADVLSRMFGSVEPEAQQMLGRYEVLRKLGAGGMGVVYLARDPELDRQVAIKLLRRRDQEGPSEDTEQRLRNEARAMARVNHAHVVHVHDVGRYGEQLFIAMEYVEGSTLTRWLEDTRTWSELLRVFIDAGEGLAAAHEADLVHRDFKPDNVLLGDDGVVKVTDFGVAVAAAVDPWETAATLRPSEADDPDAPSVVGTLRYMSPEQLRGQALDARSDQFSFCVALYEALVGQHPFARKHPGALLTAIMTAERWPLPGDHGVPRWLLKVIERGMHPKPEQRWPSMRALLDRLRDDPAVRRRRWLLGATATVGLAVGAFVVGREATLRASGDRSDEQREQARRAAACVEEGDGVDALWNDEVRARLHEGLASVDVSYAKDTADKVLPYFDAQVEAIRRAQTEACLDAQVRQVWDEELHQLATWCLDERRLELESMARELGEADERSVSQAVKAAATLLETQSCRNAHRLRLTPIPPDDPALFIDVRRQLSMASAQSLAGRYDDALATTTEALAVAEATGWPALVVAARYRHGRSLELTGSYAEAEAVLEQAYFEAARVGAVELQASIGQHLAFTVGDRSRRHDEGILWGKHTAVALDALQEPEDGLRRAMLDGTLGVIHGLAGDFAEATRLLTRNLAHLEALFGPDHPELISALNNQANIHQGTGALERSQALHERALAIVTASLGPEHPQIAVTLSNLSIVHQRRGAYREAIEATERAIDILESALGAEHPTVASALTGLGNVYLETGDYAQAISIFERARVLFENSVGEDHEITGRLLNNLAIAHEELGEYDEAIELTERALAIKEVTLGSDHPEIATTLNNLASARWAIGEREQARRLFERSLAIREATLGPEHSDVAGSLSGLAGVLRAEGEPERARALLDRALGIQREALGAEHPKVAILLVGLAQLDLDAGSADRAIVRLERAVSIHTAALGPDHHDVAEAQFLLARALWDAPAGKGRDRTRARDLARRAVDGVHPPEARAEIERWLDSHGP